MINKILAMMNGESMDPVALRSALEQIERDRITACAAIADIEKRRHQALLDDADDKVIDKFDRDLERAAIRLEKLNVAEQPLRARIDAAKAEARHSGIERHRALIGEKYKKLRAAVFSAEDAQRDAMAARAAAIAELGETALVSIPFVVFAGGLGRGYAAIWASELDGAFAASTKRASIAVSPLPAKSLPAARPAARTGDAMKPHSVQLDSPQVGTMRAPDEAKIDMSPLSPAEQRVRVLRSGYCDEAGHQRRRGDVIHLHHRVAELAANCGAVEILTDEAAS